MQEQQITSMEGQSSIERMIQERIEKADTLRKLGENPYANDFKPSISIADFCEKYAQASKEELAQTDATYCVAGRVMGIRRMGKASFLHMKDQTGSTQVFLQYNQVGEEQYKKLELLDLGDIIGIVGTPMRTNTNELSLRAQQWRILVKGVRPLPEKWHGLSNVEQRYRQRYLDLLVHEEVRHIFWTRFRIIRLIQHFLDSRGFMEAETPILCDIPGGAAAKPFETHHNALGEDLTLRIATELHLKRLLVGGFERVYEIGRIFRNEGVSTRHNPEFTSIEFYQAYSTYEDLIELTQVLLQKLAQEIHGDLELSYQEQKISFATPFRRASVARLVGEHLALNPDEIIQLEQINQVSPALHLAYQNGVSPESLFSICLAELTDAEQKTIAHLIEGERNSNFYQRLGGILDELWVKEPVRTRRLALHIIYAIFEHGVEKTLWQPTFVTDFSVSVSPLARKREGDPAVVDRFELFCAGMEIANAFSELNDPVDQRERLLLQQRERALGNEEAHEVDEDFLQALEIGMPPAAGEGIGIDRLVMLLTNSASIREVILFPKMKMKHK